MDERIYNQPDGERDSKTTDCEVCNATGFIYCNDSDDPNDPQPIKEPCTRCEGKGYLEY